MYFKGENWVVSDNLSVFSYQNNPDSVKKCSWECATNEISNTNETVACFNKHYMSQMNVFLTYHDTFNFYDDYVFTLDVFVPQNARTFCMRLETDTNEQFSSHCTALHSNKWCRLKFEFPHACKKIIKAIHIHVHWNTDPFVVYMSNLKTPILKPNFVLLVTGQSNAQGGYALQEDCEEDRPVDNVKAWNVQHNAWITANLKENFGTKYAHNQNFGFHCAKELLKMYPDIVPGIVCCAMSGMPIRRWCKAPIPDYITPLEIGWYWYTHDGDIYDASIDMMKNALHNIESKCSLVLWSQGQGDAYHSNEFYDYALKNVISQYNKDLIDPFFIACEIPQYGATTQNIILQTLNHDQNLKTRCVAVGDIDQMDSWHFSSYGLRELGKRFAQEYKQLINGKSDFL